MVDAHGRFWLLIELQRTLMDGGGQSTRGLQNRLRGAAEASWVGSIPIHPRHLGGRESQDDSHIYVFFFIRNERPHRTLE